MTDTIAAEAAATPDAAARTISELQIQNGALESLVLDLIAVLETVAPAELSTRLALPGSKVRKGQMRPLGTAQEAFRRNLISGGAETPPPIPNKKRKRVRKAA